MAIAVEEYRDHVKYAGRSEFGRSTVSIVCPFCSVETEAFKWSLAGSGKRCQCGAIHTSFGQSRKATAERLL